MDHKQYKVELDEKLPHPLPKQKKGQGTKSKSLDFNHFDITKTTFHENSRGLRLQTTADYSCRETSMIEVWFNFKVFEFY